MSNASAHLPTTPTAPTDGNTVTTQFKGGRFQIHQMHYTHWFTQHAAHSKYNGALMDSGANGDMAGSDTRVLATVPHTFVDNWCWQRGTSMLTYCPVRLHCGNHR